MIRKLLGLIALVGLGSTAQAAYVPATWSDTVTTLQGGNTIGDHQVKTYVHDLGSSFTPGSDLITNFSLSIDLYDDQLRDSAEAARIYITGIPAGTVYNFGNDAFEGASIFGWAELNLLGTLTVTIQSLYGDFVFGKSELVANGYKQGTNSVPEPATLGLLGLGLLGVAAGTRRRKVSK